MPGAPYLEPPTERFHESAQWRMRIETELDRLRNEANRTRRAIEDHVRFHVEQAERAPAEHKEPQGGTDTMAPRVGDWMTDRSGRTLVWFGDELKWQELGRRVH